MEILMPVKGIDFEEAFAKSTLEMINEILVWVVHLNHLIAAKKPPAGIKT